MSRLTPRPLTPADGAPGWYVATPFVTYRLWAPTAQRPEWAASWKAVNGAENLARSHKMRLALDRALVTCPYPERHQVGMILAAVARVARLGRGADAP
jgi:hypothetical protein